jgi:glutamyl-tRNA synthetase
LVKFDHLINKPKLDDGDNFQDFLTENTRMETSALADACLRTVPAGTVLQLERKGFYRVDKAYEGPDSPAILFFIPDGKVKGGSAVEASIKSKKK